MTRSNPSRTASSPGDGSATTAASAGHDALQTVVREEESCLDRVQAQLQRKSTIPPAASTFNYDAAMLELRDEIASARMEDVPPLIEQMDRLQRLAAQRRESRATQVVDVRSPYFGRLVLQEGERRREVLIGRSTYIDTDSGVRIVDWRDAPVSRLYYRYDEGDDYCETFGDREVEGDILTRRTLTILDRELRRITAPQGTFAKSREGDWHVVDWDAARLRGGQGTAARATHHHEPKRLGVLPEGEYREDKHLREITALIDRRQFDLITRPDSGLVVIQGGAGSGKTTIGLHRLAYLAFHDPRRFRPDRTLVVVFNEALARYISLVLPALGMKGVGIRTYEDWASRLRTAHLPQLPSRYCDDTPAEVTRLKKHPAMLRAIDAYVQRLASELESRVRRAFVQEASGAAAEAGQALLRAWQGSVGRPLTHRLHALSREVSSGRGRKLPTDARVVLEREIRSALEQAADVVGAWSDLLSDRPTLGSAMDEHAPGAFTRLDLDRAHAWCAVRCSDAVIDADEQAERASARHGGKHRPPEPVDDGVIRHGIDGRAVDELPALDREDDTLLLRLHQKLRGPLMRGRKAKEALTYEHVFVDEAQDLSPVELAVVVDTLSNARCITLAGDVAQRLYIDNGFTDWKTVLGHLKLAHVEIEPLRLSYRSTQEIIDFSQSVLGPLAPAEEARATRHGVPVEMFAFAHSGEAAGFLAEALRTLIRTEPQASVAVIARFPEQADIYYDGLKKSEVPYLRRIVEQDFPFKPGIDVTDIRQVKGLEFDYVVLVEVNDSSFPPDDLSRHLLHIAATRAAHQLWILTSSRPSPLLPRGLVERGY